MEKCVFFNRLKCQKNNPLRAPFMRALLGSPDHDVHFHTFHDPEHHSRNFAFLHWPRQQSILNTLSAYVFLDIPRRDMLQQNGLKRNVFRDCKIVSAERCRNRCWNRRVGLLLPTTACRSPLWTGNTPHTHVTSTPNSFGIIWTSEKWCT